MQNFLTFYNMIEIQQICQKLKNILKKWFSFYLSCSLINSFLLLINDVISCKIIVLN